MGVGALKGLLTKNKRRQLNTDVLRLAGAIRIELISLVLETKAQPLYQTPRQRSYYITKKMICQLNLPLLKFFFANESFFCKKIERGLWRKKSG